MREIKFRIYFEVDEDEPAWMSEPIILLDLLHGEDIEFRDEEDTVSLPLNDFRFFYKPNEKYKLMQYTGIKDKNGKEIYEGDILKVENIDLAQIIYDEDRMAWGIEPINDFYFDSPMLADNVSLELQVIGNIYENPELLKEGK